MFLSTFLTKPFVSFNQCDMVFKVPWYELGKGYDFHLAYFSKDYRKLDKIQRSCNVPTVEENLCPELESPQLAPEHIMNSN